jgi:ABC-type sugar transport system ATPase subunit
MEDSHILEMRGIRKAFPGVQALDGVDLMVKPGEVMALVGENGAGKSTLIKVLAGAHKPDEGEIFINGNLVQITTTRQAQDLGVAVIYQELNLAEQVSVAENIFVGREFRNWMGFIDYNKLYAKAQEWLDALHVHVDPRMEVRKLTIARKQMVEIAKALSLDATIIVMDEPTSSLPSVMDEPDEQNEVEILLNLVTRLRNQGKAIIYISHRMEEIFRIADRITVMRDGKLVGVRKTAESTPDQIVSMMVGRNLEDLYGQPEEHPAGETVLEVRDLQRARCPEKYTFSVRSGEILGVTGLIGSGRTEMARALFGADKITGGEVLVGGRKVRIKSPRDAIQAGIGYLPEDRKMQGLFLKMPISVNMSAANLGGISQGGFLNAREEMLLAEKYIKQLNIRTPSFDQLAKNLSGGNQQKVVLAKWLAVRPKVLIVDEPTRGVDVGAKVEIYALLREMARLGMAVVMISSELPEVLGLSDRVIVMREERLVGELTRAEASEEKIMALATGVAVEV